MLPDGCMDIIWATDGSLVVAGPDTTAFITSGAAGSTMTGIRFAPGFAPKLLGVPAHELRNRREPLDAVIPSHAAHRLADPLAATDEPAAVLEAMAFDVDAVDDIDAVAESARGRGSRSARSRQPSVSASGSCTAGASTRSATARRR